MAAMAADTTPTAPVATPPATPTPTRQTMGTRIPPPIRVAYTRHATAGDNDDRIVNPAWYRFLIIMLLVGGPAILFWIFFGGFQMGRATVTTAPVTIASPAPAPVHTPAPVAIPPAPTPAATPAPIKMVVETPPPLAGKLSDAEQRNEALKERLRKRHGT